MPVCRLSRYYTSFLSFRKKLQIRLRERSGFSLTYTSLNGMLPEMTKLSLAAIWIGQMTRGLSPLNSYSAQIAWHLEVFGHMKSTNSTSLTKSMNNIEKYVFGLDKSNFLLENSKCVWSEKLQSQTADNPVAS